MMATLANRHMIYPEILGALISISIGISVWFSKGMLWQVFSTAEFFFKFSYSAWLGLPLIAFGTSCVLLGGMEWLYGRTWGEATMLRWTRLRFWVNIALFIANASMLVALIQKELFWAAPAVTMNSIILSVAFAFAAVKSRLLFIILNPEYKTERLRREYPFSW